MSIPALVAERRRQKLRADKRRSKAKRIRANVPYVTNDGRVLPVPPRWTLKTAKARLREELHAAIRERDGAVCISCGKAPLHKSDHNAGHLFAVGPFPGLRFNPFNLASQCAGTCNNYRRGNHAAFAAAVIRRHGLSVFEALDAEKNVARQWRMGDLLDLLDCLRRGGIEAYSRRYFEITGWTVRESAA